MTARRLTDDDRVAQPGDPDLDFDVSGLRLVAVTTVDEGRFVTARLEGGVGWYIPNARRTDRRVEWSPFDLGGGHGHVQITAGFPDAPDAPWDYYRRILGRWAEVGTPLRMTAALGRATVLSDDTGRWLAVPRDNPRPRSEGDE